MGPVEAVFMMFGWVAGSFLVGYVWQERNLGLYRGFWISILLSPIIALVIGVLMPRGPEPKAAPTLAERSAWAREASASQPRGEPANVVRDEMKRCPFCAEDIKAAAVVCRYCGRDLPMQTAVVAKTETSKS